MEIVNIACPSMSDRPLQEWKDSKVTILLCDNRAENIRRISAFLSDLKECDYTICDDRNRLIKMVRLKAPEFILLNFDWISDDYVTILKDLHHRDPRCAVLVYLNSVSEETRTSLLMAGASECFLFDEKNVQGLFDSIVRRLISFSEQACSDSGSDLAEEGFPVIAFSLDLEGKFINVNSAVTHLLGYQSSEMRNTSFADYIAIPSQRERLNDFLQQPAKMMNLEGIFTLETSLGIAEDFQLSITLMEGELFCGNAKKVGLGINANDWKTEQRSEIEKEEIFASIDEPSTWTESLPETLGPYRIAAALGEGSMGCVFKGFDEDLERPVAIKMINRKLASDAEYIERFRKEARILASINHPNIALIYYFDVWNGLPFFCMEYLAEGSVDRLLKKGALDPDTAISFITQVALGLQQANEKGVIHLDIKPSNLMLAGENNIKIVDFGLAATHHDLLETSDTIVGTPSYLAPEQLSDSQIDHRCDIYSLGITFYEMVYGVTPYTGKSIKDIFSLKLTQDIPDHSSASNVPKAVHDLISRMTHRDPNQRIQHYAELIEELRNLTKMEPATNGEHDEPPQPRIKCVTETSSVRTITSPSCEEPVSNARLASLYSRKAAEDYGNGRYWTTVQNCKKALEYMEDHRIYHLMAKALSKHPGFRYDAMKAYRKALELEPQNIGIQKDIADLYLACGNTALAQAQYKNILAKHPNEKHCAEKLYEIEHRNDLRKIIGRVMRRRVKL